MYLKRIAKWRLDKKKKEPEMRAIVRKEKDRRLQGKVSKFRTRGRTIDYSDAVHYWKRKNLSVHAVLAQCGSRETTPEALECFTPAPSPISALAELEFPERIFKAVANYYHGSFDSGTWSSIDPRCSRLLVKGKVITDKNLYAWRTRISSVCDLLDDRKFWEAGRYLLSAFAAVKEILLQEDSINLPILLGLMNELLQRGRPEIFLALARHYTAMGEIVLCKGHPLPRITALLSLQSLYVQRGLIQGLYKSIGNVFGERLGDPHLLTIEVRYHMILGEEQAWDAIRAIGNDTPRLEALLGIYDPRCLRLHHLLAAHYFDVGRHDEAEKQGLYILRKWSERPEHAKASYYYEVGLRILSTANLLQDKLDVGEAFGREYIACRLSRSGKFDVPARQHMIFMESWLLEAGRWKSARELEQWRLALLTAEIREQAVEDKTTREDV